MNVHEYIELNGGFVGFSDADILAQVWDAATKEEREKKTAAVRANAKKPRGKWVTALYYTAQTKDVRTLHGLVMCKGNLNEQWETYKAYEDLLLIHGVKECDVHAIGWESSRIKV